MGTLWMTGLQTYVKPPTLRTAATVARKLTTHRGTKASTSMRGSGEPNLGMRCWGDLIREKKLLRHIGKPLLRGGSNLLGSKTPWEPHQCIKTTRSYPKGPSPPKTHQRASIAV